MPTRTPTTSHSSKEEKAKKRVVTPPDAQRAAPTNALSTVDLQQAAADPRTARPSEVLAIQRRFGNQAVTQLIQAKLTVGAAHNAYEQEADRVAAQVISAPDHASTVQRSAEEEEEIQAKPLAAAITPLVQRAPEDEDLQAKFIQRETMSESEEASRALVGADPQLAPPQTKASNKLQFEAGEETHHLWVEQVGDQLVVMVASDPVTVPQQLLKWSKEAKKMDPSPLKTNILEWIGKCWTKVEELQTASSEEDRSDRASQIHEASANLKEMIKKLFWAFHMALPELGAVAVYRGLHFTTDWETKRGRTVEEESARSFESVKEEGSYSSATWELAKGLAGSKPVSQSHLESANRIVMGVLAQWKRTTDYTRDDQSKMGVTKAKTRDSLTRGIEKFMTDDPDKAQELQERLDAQKGVFTQSGYEFENLFMAALSRYIDSQKTFELELKGQKEVLDEETQAPVIREEKSAYKDVPFTSIPFISTSKDAKEAVKYAQGKLAGDKKSTEGVVGRVLVYVANRVDMLEAGGIDVWQELSCGKLNFTSWRMAENEITFAGKIPDYFLRDMTPVTGEESVEVNANRAEIAAAKAAVPFGGLKPLPENKPLK